MLFVACKSMASQPYISGSLYLLLSAYLNDIGVRSTPVINVNRVFYGCAKADISIEKECRRGKQYNYMQKK